MNEMKFKLTHSINNIILCNMHFIQFSLLPSVPLSLCCLPQHVTRLAVPPTHLYIYFTAHLIAHDNDQPASSYLTTVTNVGLTGWMTDCLAGCTAFAFSLQVATEEHTTTTSQV